MNPSRKTFFTLGLLVVLASLFALVPATASAETRTLYFNGTGEWTLVTNWWNSRDFTGTGTHPDSVPDSDDDIFIPDAETGDALVHDNSSAASVGNATFEGDSQNQISITVSGTATFTDTSINYDGEIIGAVIFNSVSTNAGTVTGNATFNASANNFTNGLITGTATFNGDGVVNWGDIAPTAASFAGASVNNGTTTMATATTTFSGTARNLNKVVGDASFADTSVNTGTVTVNAFFINAAYTSNPVSGTIGGSTIFSSASTAITTFTITNSSWSTDTADWVVASGKELSWVFAGSSFNTSNLIGDATFTNTAYTLDPTGTGIVIGATISGDITFSSAVTFTLTDYIWYADTSNWIFSAGTPTWDFVGYSQNYSTLKGNATFRNTSYNYGGTITGDATFYNGSYNTFRAGVGGIVNGNATFNNMSGNIGIVGTTTPVITTTTFNDGSSNESSATIYGNVVVNYPSANPIGGTVSGGTVTYLGYGELLYFNDSAREGDGNWNSLDNWWQDAAFSIPADALPTSADNVVITTPVTTKTGPAPAVANNALFAVSVTNSISLTATTTFSSGGVNTGTITGDVIFGGNSGNSGTINGDARFDSGSNQGEINGDVIFTSALYYLDPTNDSEVTGDITFSNTSGTVFRVNGWTSDSAAWHFDATPSWVFSYNSHNSGTITAGDVSFINNSYNAGTINTSGIVTFNQTNYNSGTVTGTAIFNDSSYNKAVTGMVGNAVFVGSDSDNLGTITGTADIYSYPSRDLTVEAVGADTPHSPFYFYGANGLWSTLSNWWTDAAHTAAAGSAADVSRDTVFLYSSVTLPGDYKNNNLYIRANDVTVNGAGYRIWGNVNGDGVNAGDDGFDFTLSNLTASDYLSTGTVSSNGVASTAGGGAGGTITLTNVTAVNVIANGGSTAGGCGAGGAAGQITNNSSTGTVTTIAGTDGDTGCDSGNGNGNIVIPPLPPRKDIISIMLPPTPGGGNPVVTAGKVSSKILIPLELMPLPPFDLNFPTLATGTIRGINFVDSKPFIIPKLAVAVFQNTVKPAVIVSGFFAGLSEIFAAGTIASLSDLYLLVLRGFGAMFSFLGIRRKRKPWGTVYDSQTKRPLDPVYVKASQDGKEVATAITDIEGRYGFNLPSGIYQLTASKTNYQFPSGKLKGKAEDEVYANLYFGTRVEVLEGEPVTFNIPMDSTGFDWNEYAKGGDSVFKLNLNREIFKARIYRVLSISGLVLAVGSFLFSPGTLNTFVLLTYVLLMMTTRMRRGHHRLLAIKRQVSGEPIPFAIVRVFMAGVNQEVKTVVADRHGRIYLLVRPGSYYLTVDRKLPDGSYYTFYKTEVRHLATGVWSGDITIPQYKAG